MNKNKLGNAKLLNNNPLGRYIKHNAGILIGLVVLVVGLTFASPYFLTMKNFSNVLRQATSNALLAYALTCVLIIGNIDLTVGSMVGIGSVLVATFIEVWKMDFFSALLLTVVFGCAIGFINGFIVSNTVMPPYIITLAMQNILRGFAYLIAGGVAIKVNNDAFYKFGNSYVLGIPIPVIVFAVIGVILAIILERTVFGRHMVAVGGNIEAARYAGINIKKVKIIGYMVSGSLAALAGVIVASRVYSGQPTAGQGFESDAIASAVLGGTSFNGGRGSIGGTIIGILIIAIVANGLNLLEVPYYWQTVVKGLVIMLAVYYDTEKQRRTVG